MYDKNIRYDRETRDYAMYLDNELIGFARTHHEAEVTLDQTVFEMLTHGDLATATELDGGVVEDELPATCELCNGEGRIPAYGYGDQAGGYAETCPDCSGGDPDMRAIHRVKTDPAYNTIPLFDDVARVLDMALGNAPAKDVVPEMRRVRARLAQV